MEEFSVRELTDYWWCTGPGDEDRLNELLSTNLAVSGIRGYDIEPDLSEMERENALKTKIHDSVVEFYDFNLDLDSDEMFEFLYSEVERRGPEESDIDLEIEDRKVENILRSVAAHYEDDFAEADTVETEKVIGNNGFYGRADILRDMGEEKELRDVKMRFADNPVPGPKDRFGMACYALISRHEHDVDRFVLEYPLQGAEFEIEPENWFSEVVDSADEFESLLEESRREQAELLREDMDADTDKPPRRFVEDLDITYEENKDYARTAVARTV